MPNLTNFNPIWIAYLLYLYVSVFSVWKLRKYSPKVAVVGTLLLLSLLLLIVLNQLIWIPEVYLFFPSLVGNSAVEMWLMLFLLFNVITMGTIMPLICLYACFKLYKNGGRTTSLLNVGLMITAVCIGRIFG